MNDGRGNGAAADAPRTNVGKRLRFRLELAIVRAASWFVPLLPRLLVGPLADAFGTLGWMVDRRGRHNGMENLRAAFGDRYSIADRRRIMHAAYRVFSRTFLDLFRSRRLTRADCERCFIFDYETPAARAAVEANNCIYITPHLGGFELLGIARALCHGGTMTVAQDFKNPPLTAVFQRLRSAGGRQPVIPQDGAMLRILKHLKRGGSAAALVDLTIKPEQNATVIRTFGLLTSVSYFHCALARRTGVPIIMVYLLPTTGGRWVVRILNPLIIGKDDDLQACAQRCWDAFEPVIRDHPQQWLWMYKHWRYLPESAPADSYPEYARRYKPFDALVRSLNGSAP
jgi:Kdo2-lipid IVA lauroyltransferase/acyltransferase